MKRFLKHYFLWVDFSKVFNFISHNYMLDLLRLLHFPPNFICAIQNLTSQASTRILFNKSVSNIHIPVQRGSRQGDPISGYLFNIALDVLNLMILQSHQSSVVHINGHSIPSLMYCDDIVICVDSTLALSQSLNVIDSFSEVSGLFINRKKSAVICSLSPLPNLSILIASSVPYLGFKFDCHGIVNQAAKFVDTINKISSYQET
eukprot:TRINITY_DN307_c0_g3_i4.p1 TRINITY_DN307_c0_g3~~TRINITY_DN307_c0_g3_i4.p1  ORF type:complete len:204 (-),score=9.85 TRINITY_DN307_c0_g3_i4:466-1077(-)